MSEPQHSELSLYSHLQRVNLTFNALDSLFGGSELTLLSGQQLSDLLSLIFVLFEIFEFQLTGFNCGCLFQPQLPQGL